MATATDIDTLRALPPEQQMRMLEGIYAGPEHPLFVQIKAAFLEAFPQCSGAVVFCGMGPGLGPFHAITVTTRLGERIRGLPARFLGMVVLRHTEGRSGHWIPGGRR